MNQLAILESLIEVLKRQLVIVEAQANDLKSCGNCKNSHTTNIDTYCEITGEPVNGHKICDRWFPDGMTREDREGNHHKQIH
jgi:hypothetical protein